MPFQKLTRITNIWSKVVSNESGGLSTKIMVETVGDFRYVPRRLGNDLILDATDIVANMPEGSMEVHDGLVREIALEQTGTDKAAVRIIIDHPCAYTIVKTEGIPVRTAIILDRSYLTKLMENKKIVIDPGHGGSDLGGKGPVNLAEKNVVLLISQVLADSLSKVGAQVVLTRTGDENIPMKKRFALAAQENADLFLSIHTHAVRNSKTSGAAVRYKPVCANSRALAGMISKELIKKLKVKDRGLQEAPDLLVSGSIPTVQVEVVTITNWVEEGLLRSPTIHKKAAEGIFIGVKEYFAAAGG